MKMRGRRIEDVEGEVEAEVLRRRGGGGWEKKGKGTEKKREEEDEKGAKSKSPGACNMTRSRIMNNENRRKKN